MHNGEKSSKCIISQSITVSLTRKKILYASSFFTVLHKLLVQLNLLTFHDLLTFSLNLYVC